MGSGRATVARRSRNRWPWLLLTLVLLAAAAVTVLLAWQASVAYGHLNAARDQIPVLRGQVASGDKAGARVSLDAFGEDTAAAKSAVHGPHWSLAAALPLVGPNVSAVQTVADSLDGVATGTRADLLEVMEVVDPAALMPVDSQIQLGPIEQATPHLAVIHREMAEADERLQEIDTSALVGPLQDPVTDVVTTVEGMAFATGAVAKAAELMPSMLGAEEPRHYLLLQQNNAEPRALGGYAGAVVLVRAHEGRIELVEQRTGRSFGEFPRPVLRLSPAEQALYGSQLGRFMGNVTAIPDFPRAGQLAREIWRRQTGLEVDGVASVDPYALQMVLRATGPVTMPDGQVLDGDNAAQVLLNDVYRTIPDQDDQDEFFADAAAEAFKRVTSGAGDRSATGEALAEAAVQGRLMLWSTRRQEQAVLGRTALGGELAGQHDEAPLIGVYLHDRTAAKMGYYQDVKVQADPVACDSDGVRRVNLEVKISSLAPPDAARLPDLLVGNGRTVEKGAVRTEVLVYAPEGGLVEGFGTDRGSDLVRTYVHSGLHVASVPVTLMPGQSTTLTYDISVPPRLHGDTVLRVTPGPVRDQFSGSAVRCDTDP